VPRRQRSSRRRHTAAEPADLGAGYGLPRATAALRPGEYRVDHADLAPDARTALPLVRLQPA
jgi:hypothetical protein